MKMYDKELIEKTQEYLKALGYIPQWDYIKALQVFKNLNFRMHVTPSTEELVEAMDFKCQAERVGPYDPANFYPDD